MIRVIGIDPGLNVTGWGVIEVDSNRCSHIAHGVIRTKPATPLASRLLAIKEGIREACSSWHGETGAIERSFVGSNASSAMSLGHARAAAILGLAESGIPVDEYSPNLVKQTVSGYGHSDKAQVALMVRLQLELESDPKPADAADALAVALTHWARTRFGQPG